MLEKNFQLSSKMRISVDHEKLENFSQNHVKFYLKYSSFVFKSLKKPSFQKFLNWMLKMTCSCEGFLFFSLNEI